MRKYIEVLSLIVVASMLLPLYLVLAQTYNYYIPISVFNNGTVGYANIGVLATINNTQLANQGYINASGLDTDVQEGSVQRTYSVADSRLGIFVPSIVGAQRLNYNYLLGYSVPKTGFYLMPGGGGNVTTLDSSTLELGSSNFTLEWKGFFDSTRVGSILTKADSYDLDVSPAGIVRFRLYKNLLYEQAVMGNYTESSLGHNWGATTGSYSDMWFKEYAGVQLKESFTNVTTFLAVTPDLGWYQTFTPADSHTLTNINLTIGRGYNYGGNPTWVGTMTVSIKAVDANQFPTGAALVSATRPISDIPPYPQTPGELEFNMGAGTLLTAGAMYAIVITTTGGVRPPPAYPNSDYFTTLVTYVYPQTTNYAGGRSGGISANGTYEEFVGTPEILGQYRNDIQTFTPVVNHSISEIWKALDNLSNEWEVATWTRLVLRSIPPGEAWQNSTTPQYKNLNNSIWPFLAVSGFGEDTGLTPVYSGSGTAGPQHWFRFRFSPPIVVQAGQIYSINPQTIRDDVIYFVVVDNWGGDYYGYYKYHSPLPTGNVTFFNSGTYGGYGPDGGVLVYNTTLEAQPFWYNSYLTYESQGAKLYARRRQGTPGIVTVSVKATDGSGNPVGAALASGTLDANTLSYGYSWADVTWALPVQLNSTQLYAVVVDSPSGGSGSTSILHDVAPGDLTSYSVYSSRTKVALRLNSFSGTADSIDFRLLKSAGATGTAYARAWKVSDGSLLGELGSIDVSNLSSTVWAWYTFNTTPLIVANSTDIRIGLEYDGSGGGSVYMRHPLTSDIPLDWVGILSYYTTQWYDYNNPPWRDSGIFLRIYGTNLRALGLDMLHWSRGSSTGGNYISKRSTDSGASWNPDGDSGNRGVALRVFGLHTQPGPWGSYGPGGLAFQVYDLPIPGLTLTAPVSSGPHTVTAEKVGGTVSLKVDGITQNSTTQNFYISNTLANITSSQNGPSVYSEYLKVVINGTQKLWYEPTQMVQTTNVVDRSGNGNTGVINWGTNPAGIEVTVGAIKSLVPPEEEVEEVFPPPILPSMGCGSGSNLLIFGLVQRAADSLGWSTCVMYSVLMIIVATAFGLGSMIATGTPLGFSMGFGIMAFGATGTGVLPWWIGALAIMFAVFTGYVWKYT